jgi:hypothetical protein
MIRRHIPEQRNPYGIPTSTAAVLTKLHKWGKCRPLLTILQGINTWAAAVGRNQQQETLHSGRRRDRTTTLINKTCWCCQPTSVCTFPTNTSTLLQRRTADFRIALVNCMLVCKQKQNSQQIYNKQAQIFP